MYLITHARYDRRMPNRSEAILTLRGIRKGTLEPSLRGGKPIEERVNIPISLRSYPYGQSILLEDEVERFRQQVHASASARGIVIDDAVIRLEGPDENERYTVQVPSGFTAERSYLRSFKRRSNQESLDEAIMHPFGLYDGRVLGLRAPLDFLRSAPRLVLDTELHNWWRSMYEGQDLDGTLPRRRAIQLLEERLNKDRKEHITYGVIAYADGEIVFSTIPGQGALPVKDVAQEMARFIREYDPLFIGGMNLSTFDYAKLGDGFAIGTDNSRPKERGRIPGGFVIQRSARGRFELDASLYARAHLPFRTNKMDDIHTGLGLGKDDKIISHEQIAQLTQRAYDGDAHAHETMVSYTLQDGMKTRSIIDALFDEMLLAGFVYGVDPLVAQSTGRKKLIERFWDARMGPIDWNVKIPSPHYFAKRSFADFSIRSAAGKVLAKMHEQVPGRHEAILVEIDPFGCARYVPVTPGLESLIERSPDRFKHHMMDLSEYPFFLLGVDSPMMGRRPITHAFGKRFERSFGVDVVSANNEVYRSLRQVYSGVRDAIGGKGTFVILPNNDDSHHALEGMQGAIMQRYDGVAIVFKDGFAFASGDARMMEGMAPPASNMGARTPFEQETLGGIVERAFVSLQEAAGYADLQARRYYAGDVAQEDLAITKVARRDFTAYSTNARSVVIEHLREGKVRAGESFSWQQEGDVFRKDPLVRVTHALFGEQADALGSLSAAQIGSVE